MKKNKVFGLLASSAMLVSLLALPINVSAAGNTIQLSADRTEALTVNAGETYVLDLNGFKMSGKVTNNGTLTIKDSKTAGEIEVTGDHAITNKGALTVESGTIDALSHAKAALWNDPTGVVTINGGSFLRSQEKGSSSTANGGNSYYNVLNHGKMTINGGTIQQTGSYSSLIENGWQDGTQNTTRILSEMIIKGGTFSGGLNTIKNDDYGSLKISGGTFGNVAQASFLNWNIAEVTGGTFTATSNAILNGKLDDVMDKGELTVTGGTFVSKTSKPIFAKMGQSATIGKVSITGGTYSNELGFDVAAGYKVYDSHNTKVVAPVTTKVELSVSSLNVEVGESAQLNATLTPSTTLDKVTYTTSNATVATVDANGKVTANAVGTAVITAKAGDKTVTCDVSVYKVETPSIPGIDTSKPVTDVKVGIQDKASQEAIANTVDNILGDIIKGNTISNDVMSANTRQAVKDAIDSGKTFTTRVDTATVEEKNVTADTKTKVNELVAKFASTNKTDAKVAQYLDLSIILVADNKDLGTINQLDKPISFTVAMPANLQKDGRKFYVVRVHNGKAEKLETVMNSDGTLTFKTDKFSTYALVYEDVKVGTPTPAPDGTVQTSDGSQLGIYMNITAMALVAGALVIVLKKREQLLKK